MVHEGRRALVCRAMHLYEQPLDIIQITPKRIEEPACLKVFRRCTTAKILLRSKKTLNHMKTYKESRSSLMIYPIPYPSAATGPNPNSLSAGFPQFEVERIDVPSVSHPPSVNIHGILLLGAPAVGSSGEGLRLPAIWRWMRQ